jgi:hypothetical protein
MGMQARGIIRAKQHQRSAGRIGQPIPQRHNRDVWPMGECERLKRQEMMQIRA